MVKLLSMYERNDRPDYEHPGGPEQEISCDIAILGGGGSGIVAAVRAAQLGARVVVVEKMDVLGGNSWYAGGLLTTTSKYQKALGMEDQTDTYYKKAFQQCKYTLDPAIFKRYIKNTGTFFEWIADMGLDTDNLRYMWDSVAMIKERKDPGPLNNPKYGPGLMGSTILSILYKKLDELGVTVLMETKANRLLTDDEGRVIGILADGMTESYRISSKAVILSSGGFGGNPELLQRFLPQYFTRDNYISHYCRLATTGEGILMAEDIGAEVGKNISVGIGALVHNPGAYSLQVAFQNDKCIYLNKNGKRFIAEDDTDDGELVVDMQPEGLAYCFFDENLKDAIVQGFSEPNFFGDRNPTAEEFAQDLQQETADGKTCIAATLAEAAEYIGCSEAALAETLERYNAQVKEGRDGDFFKAPEHLTTIGKAPYYIIRLQRNFDVTMGGVSVNEHIQAVDPNNRPIPGLYVTGDAASNWMGTEYGPLFSSFAWAMNSGYLAGEEASAFIREN